MLFALFDLMQYFRKRGNYGLNQKDAAMGYFSVFGTVPAEIKEQLEVGDLIFTQRLNSVFSWGAMYFASSCVGHIAIHVGDGQVLHMTLGGEQTRE